jgi:hypothetical protein
MNRFQTIAGWTASVLAILPLAGSAIPKLFLANPGTELYTNFEKLGFNELLIPLGIIGLILSALVLIRRTALIGIIGTFGYWSGALATELTHGTFNPAPVMGMVMLVVAAWFRTPEVFDRILDRNQA